MKKIFVISILSMMLLMTQIRHLPTRKKQQLQTLPYRLPIKAMILLLPATDSSKH